MTTTPGALPELRPDADDATVSRILDAALEQFEDVGIRKTTLEDIARRAGVDRVTVYRRLGSKNDVASAVVARDLQRLLTRVAAEIEAEKALEERVVAAFISLMVGFRDHPLFNRLVRLEPDQTLPRVTINASELLATGIQWAAAAILPAGSSAAELKDMTTRIEIVGRFIHSSMLTRQAIVDLSTTQKMAAFARKYIVPIVVAPT